MAQKVLFETKLTDTSDEDIEGIGTIRFDQYGNKYRWIYNASAFASRLGAPACFDVTLYSGSNFLKHVLAAPSDDDITYLAGVFLSVIPTLNYGWIQCWGLASAIVALATGGSSAAGDLLLPSTLTATTGTAAARPYCFINGVIVAAAPASTVDFPSSLGQLIMPHAFTPAALATSSVNTTTVPQTFTVFVKGLV